MSAKYIGLFTTSDPFYGILTLPGVVYVSFYRLTLRLGTMPVWILDSEQGE